MDDTQIVLAVCETIFLINLIINFFLQANDDSKTPLKEELSTVAHRYLTGRFFLDLIVWLPMGFILSKFDERLRFTWCIKGLRVIDLNRFVSDKFWNPIIRSMFDKLRAYFINRDSA